MLTPWAKGPGPSPTAGTSPPKRTGLWQRVGWGEPHFPGTGSTRASSAQGGQRLRSDLGPIRGSSWMEDGDVDGTGGSLWEVTATSTQPVKTGAMSTRGASPGAGTIQLPLLGIGGAALLSVEKPGARSCAPRPTSRLTAQAQEGAAGVALA